MLVSYRWLQEYVATTTPSAQLGEKFLMTSSELENLTVAGQNLQNVKTGRVLTCIQHPQADRLHVVEVDLSTETRTIVCGAPNIAVGQIVLVALPGAEVTSRKGDSMVIQETSLRGVISQGMICAAEELGIPFIQDSGGIWVLPEDTQIGVSAQDALGLNDTVLDLEITPNRPDLLSHIGLAREVATFENRPLTLPAIASFESNTNSLSLPLVSHIHQHADCTRLSMIGMSVTQNSPSPWWMQRRLILAGMRPLNAIVDVTNYVMLEFGQPLHAYDISTLKSMGIKKLHFQAEKVTQPIEVTTLDGLKRVAEPGDCLITLNGEPAGFAGIMGGLESSIQSNTTEIVLEAASFNPGQIRRTSRRLGLRSEASTRFEKGIDPELPPKALARAVHLLQQMGVATLATPLLDHMSSSSHQSPVLTITTQRFEDLMGVSISVPEAKRILEHLGFAILGTSKTSLKCSPPSWRADVTLEEDVIEELMRIWGFDRIPLTLPQGAVKAPQRNKSFYDKSKMATTAASLGYLETIHIPFCSQKQLKLLHFSDAEKLDNPLTSEQEFLIPSHIIPLLNQAAAAQQYESNRFFEIGAVFHNPHQEKRMVSALLRDSKSPELLFREAKLLLESVLCSFECTYEPLQNSPSWTSNVIAQAIVVQGVQVGLIGLMKPSVVSAHKIRRSRNVVFFEFNFDIIQELPTKKLTYVAPSNYPAIERDITLIIDEGITWNQVEAIIKNEHLKDLSEWNLTDIFRGSLLPDHSKSYTIHFVYKSQDHTLTDAEIDLHQSKLIDAYRVGLHATIS